LRKEIVDIEITMYQSAGTTITGTIALEPITTGTTTMESFLLKLTVSREKEVEN
jgi:hypothetical protein